MGRDFDCMGVVGVFVFGSFEWSSARVSAKKPDVAGMRSEAAGGGGRATGAAGRPDSHLWRRAGLYQGGDTVFGKSQRPRRNAERAGPAAKIAANGRLDSAIGRLLLLTENYPQLRSSDQFMRLQDELAGPKNRISVARRRYNDALRDYNTFVLQFPNSIWAGIAGFHENNAFFTASPARRPFPPSSSRAEPENTVPCRRLCRIPLPQGRVGLRSAPSGNIDSVPLQLAFSLLPVARRWP